ncbi:hypothetical protein SUDANB58_03214 [Streptomyces sp. enrichment culture]|uniref:hypothetical protein n=1 Tax=Streptomyces sp. enrichment culture TaxID=1795815 RepID=UPI003F5428D2
MLPPSAIAGVSLVCALGPWVFGEPMVLRPLAAVAAVTAITGAFVMRHWDVQAGRRVAELTRARASDEWRHEERVAELESDLEESRAMRARLERRLRAKRAELQALRNEHAALLRRYATAETERAGALEGRRLLENRAASPARALETAVRAPQAGGARSARAAGEEPGTPGVFSPEGARLFLRASVALSRLGGAAAPGGGDGGGGGADHGAGSGAEAAAESTAAATATGTSTDAVTGSAQAPGHRHEAPASQAGPAPRQPAGHFAVPAAAAVVPPAPARRPAAGDGFDFFGTKSRKPQPEPQSERQPEPQSQPEPQARTRPGARAASPSALEAVQDEDLADIVGQEALALHGTGAGEGPEREGAQPPQEGRVIDLTAHDETEQIDVQGLRTAAS